VIYIGIITLANLSDAKVFKIFKEARYFTNNYKPFCPKCGSTNHYKSNTNNKIRYKCNDCLNYYSITSNTIFDNHKLSLKTHLLALTLFINSVKGISSLQIARDLNIGEKSAYILLHKIRMALIF
jgi:transposase-like protein